MSGGSWNYAYSRVRDAADDLRHGLERRDLIAESEHWDKEDIDSLGVSVKSGPIPLRAEFADVLDVVAAAMRDIEWSDSGDTHQDHWRQPVQALVDACADLVAEQKARRDAV